MTVTLRWAREPLEQELSRAVGDGQAIADSAGVCAQDTDRAALRDRWLGWVTRVETLLSRAFETSGFMESGPKGDFTTPAISLLSLRLGTATDISAETVTEIERVTRAQVQALRALAESLDIYAEPLVEKMSQSGRPTIAKDAPIFLVHGHDVGTRELVRRFLEQVTDRRVIVLQDQPGRGASLLDKLLTKAEGASFCVVLITGDDEGRVVGQDDLNKRARQNVVFELGLFVGLLGRDCVVALYQSGVELPSDYQGVEWLPLEGNSWQIPLARELSEAKINVDINKTL